MKTKLLLLPLLLLSIMSCAQTEEIKFIKVTGSAEMSIQPDQINLQITIREYQPDTRVLGRLDIVEIEKRFFDILEKHKIDGEQVNVASSGSSWYWYYWWRNRHQPLKRKVYTLSLNADQDIIDFVKDLDEKWVENLRIVNSTHSKLVEYRHELKLEAIRAAKQKATNLLAAVDEEIGGVLTVEEANNDAQPNIRYWGGNTPMVSNVALRPTTIEPGVDNVQDIKLRYEIKVKFAIK